MSTILYDIIVPTPLALRAIPVAQLRDGAVCYVISTKQYFDLDKTSGAADNGTTIFAPLVGNPIAGSATARWLLQVGVVGATGATGATGAQGTPGAAALSYASFFALMPGDNAGTVGLGTAVLFPQDGPTSGAGITRASSSTFTLAAIGTYEVSWQVSVTEPGQLVVGIDGVEQLPTTAGRATGTSQISNDVLITTAAINKVLSIRNPAGNSAALTITSIAGGTLSASAWLVVKRIA